MTIKTQIDPIGAAAGFAAASAIFPIMTKAMYYSPKTSITNTISLGYMLSRYYFGNLNDIKPAAVIGGIPLGTVEELSHGISDRETRYRAQGGIFLAHKEGGNESLRIVGKAWGENRFMFLSMLDFLFLWGSSTVVDYFKQTNVAGYWNDTPVLEKFEDLLDVKGPLADRTSDPWYEVEEDSMNDGFGETRATFPIITKNRIYLSMYIETYTWSQAIDKNGRKCVTYTMFFRKYEPEPEYEFARIKFPPKKEGQPDLYRNVYRQTFRKDRKLWGISKAAMEILPTLALQSGGIFNLSLLTNFAMQMGRNFFGIGTEEEGKIPGIIEQRFF